MYFSIHLINFLKFTVIVRADLSGVFTEKELIPLSLQSTPFRFNDRRSTPRSIPDLPGVIRGTAPPCSFCIKAARNFSSRQIRCYVGPRAY